MFSYTPQRDGQNPKEIIMMKRSPYVHSLMHNDGFPVFEVNMPFFNRAGRQNHGSNEAMR
jgi:hypothetical protein